MLAYRSWKHAVCAVLLITGQLESDTHRQMAHFKSIHARPDQVGSQLSQLSHQATLAAMHSTAMSSRSYRVKLNFIDSWDGNNMVRCKLTGSLAGYVAAVVKGE